MCALIPTIVCAGLCLAFCGTTFYGAESTRAAKQMALDVIGRQIESMDGACWTTDKTKHKSNDMLLTDVLRLHLDSLNCDFSYDTGFSPPEEWQKGLLNFSFTPRMIVWCFDELRKECQEKLQRACSAINNALQKDGFWGLDAAWNKGEEGCLAFALSLSSVERPALHILLPWQPRWGQSVFHAALLRKGGGGDNHSGYFYVFTQQKSSEKSLAEAILNTLDERLKQRVAAEVRETGPPGYEYPI